jgi:hypothetical protein
MRAAMQFASGAAIDQLPQLLDVGSSGLSGIRGHGSLLIMTNDE